MSSRSFKGNDHKQQASPKRAALHLAPNGTPTAWDAVLSLTSSDLPELYGFWSRAAHKPQPGREGELRAEVVGWMCDEKRVLERVESLGRRLAGIVRRLVEAPSYRSSVRELAEARELSYLGPYDLEATLSALVRRGLLVETGDSSFDDVEGRAFALPLEVGDSLSHTREKSDRRVFDIVTLRGFLDGMYAGRSSSPQRLREMYKMYATESAAVARIDRLPDGVRDLVEKAILEFGGFLPKGLFERMRTDLPHWNGRRWQMILEKSLVGTVERLDLTRYGIRHADETLVVFNEVALAWLRRVAVPGDPDSPHEELSLGIDLVSNLSQFLAFILEHDVRFTVRGEIFKTTERKILQHLIPNPGRELSREDVLAFIYRFSRRRKLIDSTGERTIGMTPLGRDWGQLELLPKLEALLEYTLEERDADGEHFHQVRLRRIFLRLVKRVEPGVWYDLMYLPFLARNTYLASLDDLEVEPSFAERFHAGGYSPRDDPQRLAWNLVRWVRKRLHLLGLVDLGYDSAGRPVAMRLTATGARCFGMTAPVENGTRVGTLVVTPDFEVVMFPTGDDAELVHDLDRFCDRDKQGQLLHYRLTEASVRRALSEGLYLERMLATLDAHSRTPVPQNVRFSIRDWALRAGLMTLDANLLIRCQDADTWTRFRQDPGVRSYVGEFCGEGGARLKGRASPRRLQSLFRELGYLIELV